MIRRSGSASETVGRSLELAKRRTRARRADSTVGGCAHGRRGAGAPACGSRACGAQRTSGARPPHSRRHAPPDRDSGQLRHRFRSRQAADLASTPARLSVMAKTTSSPSTARAAPQRRPSLQPHIEAVGRANPATTPVGPVGPVGPGGLAGPARPAGPTGPSGPTGPTVPVELAAPAPATTRPPAAGTLLIPGGPLPPARPGPRHRACRPAAPAPAVHRAARGSARPRSRPDAAAHPPRRPR